MLTFDVRKYTDTEREAIAWRIRNAEEFPLPRLSSWNYELCRKHRNGWVEDFYDEQTQTDGQRTVRDRPKPGCRDCGIHFRQHQRVSIAWLYMKKRALLADTMGSGKTSSAGGLIAMLIESGELSLFKQAGGTEGYGRVVVVPRSPALNQWYNELLRMMPGLNVIVAEGPAAKRREMYGQPWQVLLIGPEMLTRDIQYIDKFDLSLLLTDDIDFLRNPETKVSRTLDRLGGMADRYVIMTGTPLQKKLPELHAVLDGIGGLQALGPLGAFVKNHVVQDVIEERDKRTGVVTSYTKINSYRRLDIVKRQMAPLVLRRTAADLKDVTLPAIVPDDIMLDLYPAQRAKYAELQKGVIRIMKDEGSQVKHTTALSALHYGAQICGGLAVLGEDDNPGTSVKLDWIISKLREGGDLEDEKVVIFVNYKTGVRALQARLMQPDVNVGFTTVWGDQRSPKVRAAAQERFWTDDSCRVLIGTRSIEQSLNLQVSRHLINMDMILNPARMAQLAGRIRRDGSAYKHVFVHNLLTVNTQEMRYLPLLEREAALAAHMWDENDELFKQLSATDLLKLISG